MDYIENNNGKVNFGGSLKGDLTRRETNRTATVIDTKNPERNKITIDAIDDFVYRNNQKPLNELLDEFLPLIILFNDRELSCFRGVDENTSIEGSKIGPSPNPHDNRYSKEGEVCLYLSTVDWAVLKELYCTKVNMQKYKIPTTILKIVDLSSNDLPNEIKLCFMVSERGFIHGTDDIKKILLDQYRSEYSFSQYLADNIKKLGHDGMIVPGVHGEKDNYYKNIVIWGNVVEKWEEWAVDNYYPYPL